MATISETGHAKNVANFETMITNCRGFGEAYNPSSNDIKIASMASYHLESKEEVRDVTEALLTRSLERARERWKKGGKAG